MLHPVLREPRIFLLGLFGLLIAAVVLFAPHETARAAKGKTANLAVSNYGKTVAAPDAGVSLLQGNGGTGVNVDVNTSDLVADATALLPILPRLGISSVIGNDTRVRKSPATSYPYRANAFLVVTFPSGGGTCTGWFIGPRTLMTAGHCVYNIDNNEWATSIVVYPGRDAGSSPYGSASACMLWSVNGWVNSENTNYDYGAIILPSNKKLGNTVGWYGFFWTGNGASLDEDKVRVYGYPGDKPYGEQWGGKGKIKTVYSRKLHHSVDTAAGESGSAVYETRTNGPYANSIHTNGVYGTSSYNRSTRINQGVFNNMVNWKNHPDCTP